MIHIAINGFGRIGRTFLRCLLSDSVARKHLSVVAINIGKGDIKMLAHMFRYDTLMGKAPQNICVDNDVLIIDGHRIAIITELDPRNIDWKRWGVEWVVESSGHFTHKKDAQKHVQSGAQYVLITAPAQDEDITIIPGVNEEHYDRAKHHIVSLGSCTTNAFLPMLKVIHDAFDIVSGMMTTIHAYTNTQVLIDVEDSDVRRARAAALNIIPTSTGASDMVGKIIPALSGKITATSLRVPVAKCSLIDFVGLCAKNVDREILHDAFQTAKNGRMKGILDITDEPLVSSDYAGNPYSVIIDAELTCVHEGLVKVFGWYDNEWAYSMRLKDFLLFVACNKS